MGGWVDGWSGRGERGGSNELLFLEVDPPTHPLQTTGDWEAALHSLTLGVGGGWVGMESLRVFALGAAVWVEGGGGRREEEEEEEEGGGEGMKKASSTGSGKLSLFKQLKHQVSSPSSSSSSLLRRMGSSPSYTSPGAKPAYTLLPPPPSSSSAAQKKHARANLLLLNNKAQWTRLPSSSTSPLDLVSDLLNRLLAVIKTHATPLNSEDAFALGPPELLAIKGSAAFALFEAYTSQVRNPTHPPTHLSRTLFLPNTQSTRPPSRPPTHPPTPSDPHSSSSLISKPLATRKLTTYWYVLSSSHPPTHPRTHPLYTRKKKTQDSPHPTHPPTHPTHTNRKEKSPRTRPPASASSSPSTTSSLSTPWSPPTHPPTHPFLSGIDWGEEEEEEVR